MAASLAADPGAIERAQRAYAEALQRRAEAQRAYDLAILTADAEKIDPAEATLRDADAACRAEQRAFNAALDAGAWIPWQKPAAR